MKEIKPQFLLTRVYEDGTQQEEPQVVPLMDAIREAKMNRRGFFGAGIAASAAVVWLSGCDPKDDPDSDLETEPQVDTYEPNSESPNSAPVEDIINCDDINAHSGRVQSLAISPDGKRFYSGSLDRTTKIWSLPEGAHIKTLDESREGIMSMAVSLDGKQLFSGGDSYWQIWSLSNERLVSSNNISGFVSSLTVTPDGRYFIIVRNGISFAVEIYLISDSRYPEYVKGNNGLKGSSIAVTPDSRHFFIGDEIGAITKWSLPEFKLVKTWKKENDESSLLRTLAITPDGKWLLAGGESGIIKIINILDGVVTKVIKAHNSNVNAIAITPDGSQFLSGSDDKTIKLWSLPNLTLKKICKQNDCINALIISPDGKLLISCSNDQTIKLWKLPELSFVSCLIDLDCSKNTVDGVTYDVVDESGRTVTYTLPCGSPIPAGAKCICNCVPGSICSSHKPPCSCDSQCSCNSQCTCNSQCSCQSYCTCQGVSICTCNKVCTCVPVYG